MATTFTRLCSVGAIGYILLPIRATMPDYPHRVRVKLGEAIVSALPHPIPAYPTPGLTLRSPTKPYQTQPNSPHPIHPPYPTTTSYACLLRTRRVCGVLLVRRRSA